MHDSPDFPLSALLSEFELSTSARDLRALGRRLAAAIGRSSPYSYKHLNSVANGSLEPGRDLRRAIQILLVQVDGGAGTVPGEAQIWSDDQRGSMVPRLPARRCVECLRKFIPNTRRRERCYACNPGR